MGMAVDYTSIQGNANKKPRLVLLLDDAPAPTTFHLIEVQPYIVSADGTNKNIVITGTNFTPSMQVILDEIAIPFTYVSSTQASIVVNFSFSEMHTLLVRDPASGLESFWEKDMFSVKSGEIVTSISANDAVASDIINIYSGSPGFEEDAKLYFDQANSQTPPSGPTGTMITGENPIYVSANEMEIVLPPGLSGAVAIYADNIQAPDIYQRDAVTVDSSALRGISQPTQNTCTVKSVNFVRQYAGWRRFGVTLQGCCSNTCNPQHFYQIQYYVDGQNQGGPDCLNVAPKTALGEWVFEPFGTHTVGARVVEYQFVKVGKKRKRICTGYSPIKSSAPINPAPNFTDADRDSISNNVENFFMAQYSPFFRLNLRGLEPLPNSLPVRIGPVIFKQAEPRVDIVLNYNLLWGHDYGCNGVSDHAFDTEPMGYLLKNGSAPDSTNGWTVEKTLTIAHDGEGIFENADQTDGQQPEIFSALDKHAQFLRVCDYACNRCKSNGLIPNLSPHNVGNGNSYPGKCSHPEHLTNGNYRVPEKWISVPRHFSTKYFSSFPAQ